MPRNRRAVPSTEDFSNELQHIPAECTSDEDHEDNPPRPTGLVAGTNSDHPPLVILNNPDEGLGSQKVKHTQDLAWFFEMDPADGTQTCRVCPYVIFCSTHCLISEQICNNTA